MKTPYKVLLFITIPLFLLVGCSDDDDPVQDVQSIKIPGIEDVIQLDKDDTFQVTVETAPPGQTVKFYSSNTNIFSVSNDGLITGNGAGIASLLVVGPQGNSWINAKYTVEVFEYVSSITTNGEYVIVPEDATYNVSSHFTAYPIEANNRNLIYKSSNPSIATVDENGIVTPVSKGVVEITTSPADGKFDITSDPIKIYANYAVNELSKSGWTVSASDQYPYYPASRIIDGSLSTFWHNNWGTSSPPPYVFLIDMKEMKEFNKAQVWRRSGYSDTRTVEIYISEKSEDGVTMEDESFTKIDAFEFEDLSASIRTLPLEWWLQDKSYTSRYIKLILPDTNRAGNNSLCEITFYNIK
ncbi:MAG: Ig-like domain-containing protein [Bacteroides sp.]|nr:Ig-like domain-containing protein [Bacteroides sp.]